MFKKIILFILLLILAIIYGNFTYYMQREYGMEWLWSILRALPLVLVIVYYESKRNRINK